MKVKRGTVKTTEIIDNPYHKFHGEIGFKIEALIAFHCETGRVCLTERVPAKAGYLPPNLPADVIWIAFFGAIAEKLIFSPDHFFITAVFARHGPAQYIGLRHIQAAKVVRYLDHILLVHHNTK